MSADDDEAAAKEAGSEFLKYGKTPLLPMAIKNLKRDIQYQGFDEETQTPILDKSPLPNIQLKGTVKLHGANTAVVLCDGLRSVQSRNRVVTAEEDFLDLWGFMQARKTWLEEYEQRIRAAHDLPPAARIRLTGEYCGPGVQTRVGISEVPERIWVLFDIRTFDEEGAAVGMPLDVSGEVARSVESPEQQLFVCSSFRSFVVEVDLNDTKAAMAEVSKLTKEVAAQCPVAEALGVRGAGEGIVWVAEYHTEERQYRLIGKTKSSEFKSTQNVKTTYNSNSYKEKVGAFAEATVSDNRCEQGLEYLREHRIDPLDRKASVPSFISWVVEDVLSEEKPLMEEMQLLDDAKSMKVLKRALGDAAVKYFNNIHPPQ